MMPVIESLDRDGDGELSANEIDQAPSALRKLDANGDGKLTGEEWMAAPPPLTDGPRFAGFDGPFGPGGPGGRFRQDRKLVGDFDTDGDGRLSAQERRAARESLENEDSQNRRGRGPRGLGPGFGPVGFGRGGRGDREPAAAGPRVAPTDVERFPEAPLYEPTVLRTLFLEFENADWEEELAAFKDTDVEVPATLIVDGKTYPNVGVHFRGMSSYMMVPEGYKRSLNVLLDFVDAKQNLYGYRTLNLLNSNGDASMLSSVLYAHIARRYIPAPKANLVKVVINGEYWGVFANVQQFNKDFLAENYGSTQGARWKVPGSPGGRGGLDYLGEDIDDYRTRYEIKTKDDAEDWRALVALCRTIDQTPPDQLEAALEPILDIDGVLWFLALDVALVNSDGYWTRASDYSIYRDKKGKFHLIPHDMNEAFHGSQQPGFGGPRGPGGRGGGRERREPFRRGPGDGGDGVVERAEPPRNTTAPPDVAAGNSDRRDRRGEPTQGRRGPGRFPFVEGGVDLDPLVALDDPGKPLRSKLLAVPALRTKYLQYIRTIAETSLDWNQLGPLVAQYRALVEKDVEADTKKLASLEAFQRATDPAPPSAEDGERRGMRLRAFVEGRRKFLLEHSEITNLTSIAEKPSLASRRAASNEAHKPVTVVINELMPGNVSTIADPQGEYDDWLELHNFGTEAVDLSGMYLTDNRLHPRKWRIPIGTTLEPGGFLIIWADEDGKATSGLHANFKLAKNGELVTLSDTDERGNRMIHRVEFGPLRDGVAYGLLPASRDQLGPLVPTPGKPNQDSER
jgi:spore coat protein CotH